MRAVTSSRPSSVLTPSRSQCHAFSDAQDTLRSLLRTASEIEQEKSQLRYEAYSAVSKHDGRGYLLTCPTKSTARGNSEGIHPSPARVQRHERHWAAAYRSHCRKSWSPNPYAVRERGIRCQHSPLDGHRRPPELKLACLAQQPHLILRPNPYKCKNNSTPR